MLITLSEILALADKGGYAVPAFNVYNLETAMGVARAAETLRAPVIMQCYSRMFTTGKARFLVPAVLELIRSMKTPACFHIDHGAGEAPVMMALRYGATGVMIDASALPLEENIAATKRVVDLAAAVGVQTEGELGHVGSTADAVMAEHTKVDEAVRFVNETGVSALAILIGTAHGRYKQAPVLNIRRIEEIRAATGLPLVLHGGSGVPDEQVRAAIAAGIRKVNFGTDLCYAFLDSVCGGDRKVVPIDLYMDAPIAAVAAYAENRIRLLGADGHAC